MVRAFVDLGDRRVEYELTRSERSRHLRVEIAIRTGLRVVLPERMPADRVEPFLKSRGTWILKKLAHFERLAKLIPDRKLEHGAKVPFLGGELTLDVCRGRTRVGRLGDALVVSVLTPTERCIRKALVAWYRAEAKIDLERRATAIAAKYKIGFKDITVRDQKTLWGSCSRAGRLSFNWRLMLGPPEVADYLICHELAHCTVRNHSEKFWRRVGELCPAWKEREAWLRRNHLVMSL